MSLEIPGVNVEHGWIAITQSVTVEGMTIQFQAANVLRLPEESSEQLLARARKMEVASELYDALNMLASAVILCTIPKQEQADRIVQHLKIASDALAKARGVNPNA